MPFVSEIVERVRALALRGRLDRELDAELRFHIAREAEERVRHGAEPVAAHREAALAFGGVERTKEDVRDARGVRWLTDLGADTRYALRSLRRNPGYVAAVVLVLGLGIGAATAVSTVVGTVLLSPLPYPDAGRLVRIFEKNSPTNLWSLSAVDVEAIRDQQRSFDAFGAVSRTYASLSGVGTPSRVPIGSATPGFFDALGVRAARGRLLTPADASPDAPAVAVVTAAFAAQSLGGMDRAVGRSVTLDGVPYAVVGVLPRGRDELANVPASIWPAIQLAPPTRRGPFWMRGIARLKPGVTVDAATRDLAAISTRIFPLWAAGFADTTARLTPVPLRDTIVGPVGKAVGLFAAAVVLVLLIAVANVATLMLVRASAREGELAVRSALGAGRSRLARLVAAETLVLSLAAGGLGAAVAVAGIRLTRLLAPDLPRLAEVRADAPVIAGAVGLALLIGAVVGAAPMARLIAVRTGVALHGNAQRSGTARRSNAVRGALVSAEFAFALPLLLGAALLVNSFLRLARVNPGFDPAGVVSLPVTIGQVKYPTSDSVLAFERRLLDRTSQLPGATDVGYGDALPPDVLAESNNFDLLDHPVAVGASQPTSPWIVASPGYLTALRVPLLEGRLFTAADTGGGGPVLIVTRSWANHFFPRERALGRQLRAGGCTTCTPYTIVGVVGDVKYDGLAGDGEAIYEPLAQNPARELQLVVRSRAPAAAVMRGLREALAAADADMPFEGMLLGDRVRDALGDPLRLTSVLAAFAGSAVLLAALGIFGLLSFVVRQRRREIGVRMALGAAPSAITVMVVRLGMRYALIGGALGAVAVLAEVRWLRSVLYEVAPTDPATIAGAVAVLLAAAWLACWIPGRRAARVAPIEAIAAE